MSPDTIAENLAAEYRRQKDTPDSLPKRRTIQDIVNDMNVGAAINLRHTIVTHPWSGGEADERARFSRVLGNVDVGTGEEIKCPNPIARC
jgi:hypothetical protein